MWLIDTDTYALRDVVGPEADRPYAVLSHTWDESDDNPLHREVTFKDMQNLSRARKLTGWAKIVHTCRLARLHDPPIRWAWIDTCCIDKSSSAELSEAINSMFRWYQASTVCYVFLKDLPRFSSDRNSSQTSLSHLEANFPNTRWLTRGWTLQELIAPRNIIFYDQSWTKRGTKNSIMSLLVLTTRVDRKVLINCNRLSSVPVGRRMSWASTRKTKRTEDMAYSLLGIFDVNMPLIYGEGQKAFIRLQEVIAQQIKDLTLFAWTLPEASTQKYHGILAPSISCFQSCSDLVLPRGARNARWASFTLSDQAVEFRTLILADRSHGHYCMSLHCSREQDSQQASSSRCILRIVQTTQGFARYGADQTFTGRNHPDAQWTVRRTPIPIFKSLSMDESEDIEFRLWNSFIFYLSFPATSPAMLNYAPRPCSYKTARNREFFFTTTEQWDHSRQTYLAKAGELKMIGLLWLAIDTDNETHQWPQNVGVVFGFDLLRDPPVHPWVSLFTDQKYPPSAKHGTTLATIVPDLKTLDESEASIGMMSAFLARQMAMDNIEVRREIILTKEQDTNLTLPLEERGHSKLSISLEFVHDKEDHLRTTKVWLNAKYV